MPKKKPYKNKKRGGWRFVQLPFPLLNDENYIQLSHTAKSLLIDIMRQYNGSNNGDLCVTLSVMQKLGWSSNSTMRRALNELLEAELVIQTRQGGRRICSLYGLTWMPIDDCKGKLDISSSITPLRPLSKQIR